MVVWINRAGDDYELEELFFKNISSNSLFSPALFIQTTIISPFIL